MELMQVWHISPLDNPGPTHKGTEVHRELDLLAADSSDYPDTAAPAIRWTGCLLYTSDAADDM
eukprot:3841767-Prorocentrum_lima.AAC.1